MKGELSGVVGRVFAGVADPVGSGFAGQPGATRQRRCWRRSLFMRSECAIRYTHQCLACISGLAVIRSLHSTCLSALLTDPAVEAWYDLSIA